MPMPLNQPQPQQSLPNATNAALSAAQQPQAKPQQPQQAQQPQKPAKPNDAGKFGDGQDGDIMKTLEEHLNSLPDKQKAFITGALQHYPNIVIPFVGIVCGQEVFQYFLNIYKQNFQKQQPQQQGNQPLPQNTPHPATGQQPNSAPAPQAGQPNTGQPQQAPVQSQPQQQAGIPS